MRTLALTATLALLAPLAAHAVAPTDGHEHAGYEPNRVFTYDVEVQRTLRDSVAWQDFLAGEGAGWTVRFDEVTGEPLRAYGAGIDLGPITTDQQAIDAVRGFLGRHARALRVSPKQLGAGTAAHSPDYDTWYVDFDAVYDGSPVWRGGFTARIKHGKLVMVGAQTYTATPRVGSVQLDASQAADVARDLGHAPGAVHTDIDAELVWLPWEGREGLQLVRAWQVHHTTTEPVGEWVSFVDSETGELLASYNEVRFIDGTVSATVQPRRVDDALAQRPIVSARITGSSGGRVNTDGSGGFSVAGGAYRVELRGPDVVLRDRAAGGAIPSFDSASTDLVLTGGQITQPGLNTWVGVHDTRDFMAQFSSQRVGGTDRDNTLTANVNVGGGSCNAFYSPQNGSINFYRAGGGCNNTGLLSDVIHHEWGHAYHRFNILRGGFDGSLSEGAADTVAFLMSDDNIIAPTFRTNGGGIRDVAPDRRYPENYVNDQRAVHSNGLIFGGAMWDLIEELEGRYSRDEARTIVGDLLTGALQGGTGIATVGAEVLLADDDDGDLSNGTPHYCEILAALDRHGLLPELAFEAVVEHEQLVEAEPDAVTLTAVGGGLDLACVSVDEIEVVYRVDGETWQRAPMTGDDAEVEAQLSGLPYGAFVEYYLEAGSATVPGGGISNPLSLYVGGVLPVYAEDFEADDGGYTSELLAGDASSPGANDWQWGTPNASPANGRGGSTPSGDPDGAFSGDNAWGNDLGNVTETAEGTPQYWNGLYQGDRHNRLNSPPIAVPEHLEGVFLRYARWLNVEDGYFDNARILADGELAWSNYNSKSDQGGFNHQDKRWVQHSVDLGEATADGQVVLSWEIITDRGLHLAGWNIDDVQLVAPATPNNRLAITDLVAGDEEEGGPTITWTNPAYAPLDRVILVRKAGEQPTGPDDGEVVFVDEEPELGAASFFKDTTGKNRDIYWYAAYGDDGTDTLGWTEAGWNADTGSGFGQSNGIAGCSCSANPTPAHLAWLGLGGLVFLLRRRSRS